MSTYTLVQTVARHWSSFLKTPPDGAELLTLGQILTFRESLEAYLLHVFGESRLHVAGICDDISFYTKKHLCEGDRERLRSAATTGVWIRIGPQTNMVLNAASRLIGIEPKEYFPRTATMCIKDGKAVARADWREPFQQIYPKT